MKTIVLFLIILTGILSCKMIHAQVATPQDASQIAGKWIQLIIDKYGDWGGQPAASVQSVTEFKNNGQVIGYFVPVEPEGFIMVSLRKEMAPVKAFNDHGHYDPREEQGNMEPLRFLMQREINAIVTKLGGYETLSTSDLVSILEIDYRESWDYLTNYIPGTVQQPPLETQNYVEGSVLVDAQWHQHCPYNNDCIFLGCTNTCDPYNYSALAGCGAIAASQVMHYWCYPPSPEGGDEYDWRHMPNDATLNSSEVEQAAVAELCHEAGAAAESTYGCDGTSSINAYWEDVFESDYYYADCQYIDRIDYPTPLWELLIQTEINNNRPISYFVVEHDIVCDGWLTTESNTYYHMNYGWNNPFTWWYLLDALWLGNPDEENMYIGVVPVNHLGPALSGTYLLTSGLPRYFDVDASGSEAVFLPGNLLQTLPGINIKGTGTSTDVAFTGVSGITTKFFTAGYQANGIHIHNGAIHLRNNGSIRLQKAY